MSDIAIRVEGLSKRYRLGAQERYQTLRDTLASVATAPFRHLFGSSNGNGKVPEHIWALKHVSFEVKRGDVVGIIGRNGAGKSTLLKILSRITEPTEGRAEVHGRVGSLLEVGTGFHPELTGRENIYLNGAILGMKKAEIERKFDEIVAFAEVDKYLDTPVKHYSSGMHVRLVFAVAAHLEPEILIVDEVLAVGDAQFQKKCLGRMSEVAAGGRTVLFVSHNMNAVENLCTKALYLENGHVWAHGEDVRAIITRYLKCDTGDDRTASLWINTDNSLNHAVMQPLYFAVENCQGVPLTSPVRNDEPLFVVIRADVRQLDPALNAGFALFNQDSELLLWSLTTDGSQDSWPEIDCGPIEFRCRLPNRFLNEGAYRLELNCSLHCRDWFVRPGYNSPAVYFEIRGGLSASPYWLSSRPGLLAPEWKWERTR